MLTNELKAIEVLMKHLVNNTSLRKEASSSFDRLQNFEATKMNLFNMISINTLLDSYNNKPGFSLEYFLFKGIIPGLYETPCMVPKIDVKYHNDIKGYYEKLIRALQDGNYTYDENNNIFVSSEEIETIIPPIWLYRLASAYHKSTYKEMFLYNKKSENNILDVNGLIDYLRHTKTFLVTMTSVNPNEDLKKVFKEIKSKTINDYADSREVKVDDIIETFKGYEPENVNIEISKYKLADAFWLVYKAEKYEPSFYTEPLEVQQKLINSWLIEFINSNDLANREAQRYILASSLNERATYHGEDIPKGEVISGLFNLYIKLLSELDFDLSTISLSDFHLTNYLTNSLQDNLAKLNEMIKLINKERILKIEAKEKASDELAKLNDLIYDGSSQDKVDARSKKYQKALEEYQEQETTYDNHQVARNQLQALITEEQRTSLANIAFDNEKIMALIYKAIKVGRVYVNAKETSLYIELYNDTLGKNVFKARIALKDLVEFISNVNLTLDDIAHTKKV